MSKNLWLKNPLWDLFWIFSPIWSFPAVFLYNHFYSQISLPSLFFMFIIFHSALHLILPIFFGMIYTPQLRAFAHFKALRFSFLIVFVLVILVLAGLVYSPILQFVLPLVSALWATWHFYKQDLGIMSIYRSRQKISDQHLIQLDRVLVLFFSLINPLHYWFKSGFRFYAIKSYTHPFFSKVLLEWSTVRILGLLLLLYYFFVQLKNKTLISPRSIFSIILFIQFLSMTALFSLPPFTEYLVRIFSHNSSELGLQLKMWESVHQQHAINNRLKVQILIIILISVLFVGVIKFYPFLNSISEQGYFNESAFYSQNTYLVTLAMIFIVAVSWLHYYWGKHVYDFREKSVRQLLN